MIVSQEFLAFSVCPRTFGLLFTPLSGAYEMGGQGGQGGHTYQTQISTQGPGRAWRTKVQLKSELSTKIEVNLFSFSFSFLYSFIILDLFSVIMKQCIMELNSF